MSAEAAGCSGKERFTDRGMAVRALRAREHRSKSGRRTVRNAKGMRLGAYSCHFCDGWHLGSDDRRKAIGKGLS